MDLTPVAGALDMLRRRVHMFTGCPPIVTAAVDDVARAVAAALAQAAEATGEPFDLAGALAAFGISAMPPAPADQPPVPALAAGGTGGPRTRSARSGGGQPA